MSVGQSNYRRSLRPHDVQGNGRNMREKAKGLFCRLGLLLVGEGTSDSSFRGAVLVGGSRRQPQQSPFKRRRKDASCKEEEE